MPETTENYHRIPVSSGHGGHEIRTIDINSSRGIKALYCTDCKEIATYLFDVDQWTMDEAKEWVEDHKEDGLVVDEAKNMTKRLDRRTKDIVGSRVRYKSYGTFKPKGVEGESDDLYVRGFFTSDGIDEVGDIITKEATVDAVERWRKWGNIRTMHDSPSGRIEKIGEADGLAWNEVVTVPVDKNTIDLIKGGVLKAYSVGIIPRKFDVNEELLEERGEDVDPWFLPLIIHEYDMVEISYVDHPANYAAAIQEIGSQSKGMSHKAVLYKSKELSGDIMDKDKEKDIELEEELEEEVVVESDEEDTEDVPESLEADVGDADVSEESPAESDPEAEEEKGDDDEEEDIVEKDQEEEFDVALAVGDIKGLITGLEERVTGLTDSLDDLADRVVERMIDAMTASSTEDEVSDDGVGDEEEVVEDKSFDENELIDRISEKVLGGLLDALVPEVTRSAKVSVSEEDADDEPETPAQKTKMYMRMTPSERRAKMKEVLAETFNK